MSHPPLNGHSCVIRTAAGELLASDGRGVRPPLLWLRENPAILRDADVADKVIGRAAALLFCHGGVRSIWAETMSQSAAQFLAWQGIAYSYDALVPAILNRGGTGLCPMEQKAAGIDDPAQAFALFDGMIK